MTSFFRKNSAKLRISLGLISILFSLNIAAAFLGFFPDKQGLVNQGRAALAELIAVNSSVFITRDDLRRMEANLKILVARNAEILSAAVVSSQGKREVVVGDHEPNWVESGDDVSTNSQIVVPIWEGDKLWGNVQLRFSDESPSGAFAFFYEPLTQFCLLLGALAFVCFYLYLGKMLKQLDPSQAIPGRVRSALDTMAEGLLVLDARQNIVLANEAFAELVKENPQQLMGRNIQKFLWHSISTADGQGLVLPEKPFPWAVALASQSVQINHMLKLNISEDNYRTFMVNCSPVLGPNGKAVGVMVSFDDITELEEKEIELRRARDDAEAANRAKSDFLANMSHEIRTPMNAILGFTEVLLRGASEDSAERKRYLNTISSSGKHLLGLINDILDLSKVESGHLEVEIVPCSVHHIIQEVVSILTVRANEKNISLEYHAIDPMPEYVLCDSAKLRQMLTNLIGNALKFTEQGGVTVNSRYKLAGDNSMLKLEVSDTGIGMTQEQSDLVFKPFEQADSSITRRFGGTGLGLTISKRFAEALGGDIHVSSSVGSGSTFSIEVIAKPDVNARILQPEAMMRDMGPDLTAAPARWCFPDANILVVDDGAENRDLLAVVLGDQGLSVETATNGKEGLKKVLARQYELVLMDVQMPEMDGYTAVRKMREAGVKIPVFALTAHAMKGIETACMEAGYSGYMAKPIDIDKLLKRLADELGATENDSVIEEKAPLVKANATHSGADPIRSTLPVGVQKFEALIQRFVARLEEKFNLMEKAAEKSDLETLSELAHWLKGSGGSVGFAAFTDPAERLEIAAMALDGNAVVAPLNEIKSLVLRVQAAYKIHQATKSTEPPVLRDTNSANKNPAYNQPIKSALVASNPALKPLVEKFVVKLGAEITEAELALASANMDTITNFAHWLKGSAGTVGLNDFTEPADGLERAGQSKNIVEAASWFENIKTLHQNIQL